MKNRTRGGEGAGGSVEYNIGVYFLNRHPSVPNSVGKGGGRNGSWVDGQVGFARP